MNRLVLAVGLIVSTALTVACDFSLGSGSDSSTGGSPSTSSGGEGPVYPATWARRAEEVNADPGERKRFRCPGEGEAHPQIYGTGVYSSHSSICTAAVHAGLIAFADGGVVEIEYLDGRDQYVGTTRNGVTSKDYGSWRGSFRFPASDLEPPEATE